MQGTRIITHMLIPTKTNAKQCKQIPCNMTITRPSKQIPKTNQTRIRIRFERYTNQSKLQDFIETQTKLDRIETTQYQRLFKFSECREAS